MIQDGQSQRENIDPFMRELKSTLEFTKGGTADRALHEKLAAFRGRLARHAYVKRISSPIRRFMHGSRLAIKYACLLILLFTVLITSTKAGRKLFTEQMAQHFALLDDMGKLRMMGKWKEFNTHMEEAAKLAPAKLENALFERFIGFSPDGKSMILKIKRKLGEDYSWAAEVNSSSIWSVDIENGRVTPIHEGGILDTEHGSVYSPDRRLKVLAYLIRTTPWLMKPGTAEMDGRPHDELWVDRFDGKPIRVAQAPGLGGRWFAVSPDGTKIFFQRLGWFSMESVVHDLKTGRETQWDTAERGVAIGWAPDSQTVITADNPHQIKLLRRVSLDGANVFDTFDPGLYGRGILGDIVFHGPDVFSVRSRDKKYSIESQEDWNDVIGVLPLRKLARYTGSMLYARERYGVYQNSDQGKKLSPIGVLNLKNGDLRSLGSSDLVLGPKPSLLVDGVSMISPGGTMVTTQHREGLQFLDLENLKIVSTAKELGGNVACWSSDSKYLALRGQKLKDWTWQGELEAYVVHVESGEMQKLGFESMRPVAWINGSQTVWINRWGARTLEEDGPIKLTISDVATHQNRVVQLTR